MIQWSKNGLANSHTARRALLGVWCAAVLVSANVAFGRDIASETPPELEGVGIEEHLGAFIPLDTAFRDSAGVRVTFRELMGEGKPTIITPVFFECPMLCTKVLNGLTDGLNQLDWTIGDKFNIITYSFNPDEKPALAADKRKSYLDLYEKPGAKQGWHFLTGDQKSIDAMNDALGFHVRRTEDGVYAHSAAIIFVSPEGKIARYVNNVIFDPRDLRLALVEASEGKVGSPMDKFLLFTCFQYDPTKGTYGPVAWKLMRFGGIVTVVLLGGCLSFMWIKDSLKRHHVEPVLDAPEDGSGVKNAG